VTVTDQAPAETLTESIARLAGCDVRFQLGSHDPALLDTADLVVINPAVDRRRSEFFAAITSRGIRWTTEIDLFLERCPARLIGVTGTAGKSTTCALIHAILTALPPQGAGRVWFGGNVGVSLLNELEAMTPQDLVVLELSSFQLEAITPAARFEIALLTNLSANHLDRHGTLADYQAAKINLFRRMAPGGRVLLGVDDPAIALEMAEAAGIKPAEIVQVQPAESSYTLRIPGRHNQRNAAAAATVARLLGVSDSDARQAMADFAGLPHRLQYVATVSAVRYFNDSKSTTAAGAVTALESFDRKVVAIVGGQNREEDLQPLVVALGQRAKAIVGIGPTGKLLLAALTGTLTAEWAPNMAQAVQAAAAQCGENDTVVLTPGAPSYGDYINYEHRGQAYIRAVEALVRG
jgi:UDP-N-acetylmuramoylalanine--D-glutamate ligase